MKITSKSILSPGRARDSSLPSQLSLSSSSRRLKNSGSLKGGKGLLASPMFPTVGKKRGCAFENPEPSSPKVTCIGQVRVKTKKQTKKIRLQQRSRKCQGEMMSFRSNSTTTLRTSHSLHQQEESLPHRNQRWVHLPMTICEAFRAVGSEFNCFLPCRSSCISSGSEKDGKSVRSESSCGAVLARWIMSLHEGDVKGRGIEFVVDDDDDEEEEEQEQVLHEKSRRRHVFDDIEINEDYDKFEQGNEKDGKVSICVPPKNALLLMRCRSDPVKMEALANKFSGSNIDQEEENERYECIETCKEVQVKTELVESPVELLEDQVVVHEDTEEAQETVVEDQDVVHENTEEVQETVVEENAEDKLEKRHEIDEEALERQTTLSSSEETQLSEEAEKPASREIEERESNSTGQSSEQDVSESLTHELFLQEDEEDNEPSLCSSFLASLLQPESESEEEDKEHQEQPIHEQTEVGEALTLIDSDGFSESEPVPKLEPEEKPGQESQGLPECLVLMMREPKLSMGVSKETWVCSTDFIRWQPEKQVTGKTKTNGLDKEHPENRLCIDNVPLRPSAQLLHQPPRSSCHYPSSVSAGLGSKPVGSVTGQKLSRAYEPFVLTRCKSEPMRNSGKYGKLEQHGVGATGVGF